ncbi:MAG: pilin [Patescibacteria group bacterium]|nr:pilin [Patescibacteria group bacterium]
MKKFIIAISFSVFLSFSIFFPALAGTSACPSGGVCIDNPLAAGGIDSPQTLIGRVINSILGVVGSLALVMFVYGGLLWMTSGGSAEQVKKGRDILIWAAIGLVIIFSAYGLVRFVIQGVGA